MDIECTVGGNSHLLTRAHAHLLETAVCSLHHLRNQSKHHGTTDAFDHSIMQNAIVNLCFGCHHESAAFTRTVAYRQKQIALFPLLVFCFDLHCDGVVVEQDRLNDGSKVHEKSAQNRQLVRADRHDSVKSNAKRIIEIFLLSVFISEQAKIHSG